MRKVGLLGLEAALVAGLLEVGRLVELPAPGAWPQAAPDLAAIAALRTVALTLVVWLAFTTLLAIGAELPRAPRSLRRASARFTPRVVRGLLAGGLAVTWMASPARAATDDTRVRSGRAETVESAATTTIPVATTTTLAPPAPLESAPPIPPGPAPSSHPTAQAPPPDSPSGATYQVVPGDNLWSIAAARVTAQLEHPATEEQVAPAWRALVDANRGRVRSGNPSLIYPGEVIVLSDGAAKTVR